MRRAEQLRGDVLAPRQVGRIREKEDRRHDGERERRRVEDVDVPAVLVPADEFLREEADRNHDELQREQVIPEAEKKIDAEDDWKRTEREQVRVAPRPRQQHVERVSEDNLAGKQDGCVADRIPIEAPVDVNRELRDRLHVVLGAQDDLGRQRSPA
jgi:hypothetical protein